VTASGPPTIVCHVGGLPADAAVVDALARLQLSARRVGVELRRRDASSELQELLAFVGLGDVLRIETGERTEGAAAKGQLRGSR
jgi:anti-anti-sigma regulatory factor